MKPITVKILKDFCQEQIKKGNGDKVIMISQDDEGNGYHYLWYAFCQPDDVFMNNSEIVEDIATKDNTIILG